MGFAWMVQPCSYLLLVCHALDETVQLYQLLRWAKGCSCRKTRHPQLDFRLFPSHREWKEEEAV
ncbi:putative mitochondrial pyruvate carrier [Helianthus debilis subsp. tardiflorus]